MVFSKKSLALYILYILSTTLIFIYLNAPKIENKNITFFFQDTNIKYKIESALVLDPNVGTVLVSRMLHNKIIFSLETFTNSVYQTLDPVFLFTLSPNAPIFVGPTDVKMLFPFEFPLFFIAAIYILRNWKIKRDKYFYLFVAFLFSVLLVGLFLPSLYPIKLLPLVIIIRTIIFLGIVDLLKDQKWTKKYFS